MSRISDGATRWAFIATVVIAALLGTACGYREEIEGRNGNRRGNRLFREMQFIDAAAEYEQALVKVPSPIIHYNLGLAYSKMYRPGYEKPILLGEESEPTCASIPNTKPVKAQVCIKRPDAQDQSDRRRFNDCDAKEVCPSSFECKSTTMCTATSAELADLAATHLLAWIRAQPSDEVLAAEKKQVLDEMKAKQADHEARMAAIPPENADGRAGELQRIKSAMDELNRRVDELTLKDDMRKLMTQAWMDTSQFSKALAFWESELAARPNSPSIMGNLAGINLKANDWRKSIEWYHKVADAEPDPAQKVAALQSIGNVAWSKLNSKTLTIDDSVELADFGLGALEEATRSQPKLGKLYALQASILNFRSLTHGASFAAAIDRSNAQDLLKLARVLIDEAKKQQGQTPTPAPPAPAPTEPKPPAPPSPSMSGGTAQKTGG
ncbi:MAG TPA: hypothetical protein VN253_16205 [Kofleriaceae bacterium]|nr:hypothetical protein [Kofleriaceae bacterium]